MPVQEQRHRLLRRAQDAPDITVHAVDALVIAALWQLGAVLLPELGEAGLFKRLGDENEAEPLVTVLGEAADYALPDWKLGYAGLAVDSPEMDDKDGLVTDRHSRRLLAHRWEGLRSVGRRPGPEAGELELMMQHGRLKPAVLQLGFHGERQQGKADDGKQVSNRHGTP